MSLIANLGSLAVMILLAIPYIVSVKNYLMENAIWLLLCRMFNADAFPTNSSCSMLKEDVYV